MSSSLDPYTQDLIRRAEALQARLENYSSRLTPAAVDETRELLLSITGQINQALQALDGAFEKSLDPTDDAQRATHPYAADRTAPISGGFIAFAMPQEGVFELPQQGEEPPASYDIDVDVYLASNDQQGIDNLVAKVLDLVRVLGYQETGEIQIENGSIFRRSHAIARQTADEIKTIRAMVERYFELAQLDLRQADVNAKEAEAVNSLLNALAQENRACIRVGSLFIIKYVSHGGQVVLVRNLTQIEMHALSRFPEIQRDPERALSALATAIASMPDTINESSDAQRGDLPPSPTATE